MLIERKHVPLSFSPSLLGIDSMHDFFAETIFANWATALFGRSTTAVPPFSLWLGIILLLFIAGGVFLFMRERIKIVEESWNKYKHLVNNAQLGVYIVQDQVIVFANNSLARLFGYASGDEMVGMNIRQLVAPLSWEKVKKEISLQESGRKAASQYRFKGLQKNGNMIDLEALGSSTEYQGKPAVQGGLIDITKRVRAEERFKRLSEAAFEAIVVSEKGICVEVNHAAEKLFGYSYEEALGLLVTDTIAIEDRDIVIHHILSDYDKPYTVTALRKDGSKFPAEVNGKTMRYDGRVLRITSVRDITEKVQAENALHKRTKELELLYQSSQELSQSLDLDRVYEQFYAFVSNIMDCDFMMISSYHAAEKEIRCTYLIMDGEKRDVSEYPPLPLNQEGKGTQSLVITSGEPLLIKDYLAQVQTAKNRFYIHDDGTLEARQSSPPDEKVTRSAIMVPMRLEGKVVGVVQVMSYKLDAYSEDDLRIMDALGSHIAIAGNNALLHKKMQQHALKLETLNNITKTLSSSLHLSELLEAILVESARVIQFDSASVFLTEENGRVKLAEAVGEAVKYVGISLSLDETLMNVIENDRPLILDDALQSPDYRNWDGATTIRGWMGIPLFVRDTLVGYLTFDSQQPGAFSAEDASLAEAFAPQIARALYNARLFEYVIGSAREMEARLRECGDADKEGLIEKLKGIRQQFENPQQVSDKRDS
jgi:PAS domain S-box-containing protein